MVLEDKLKEAGIRFKPEVASTLSKSDDILQLVEEQIEKPSVGTQADWVEIKQLILEENETFKAIKPLQTIQALKGVKGYRQNEAYNIPDLLDIIKHACKGTICPVSVERKADGLRVLWWKHKDKIKVFLESGEDRTSRFPKAVDQLKKIPVETFLLDSETEGYENGIHQGRETVSGYVNKKDKPNDSHIVANVFDILYFSDPKLEKHNLDTEIGDLHNEELRVRHQYLDLIDLGQAKDELPKPSISHFNRLVSHTATTESEIRKEVERVSKLEGSEGSMVKLMSSTYPLTGMTSEWAKYKVVSELHVAVLKRIETATKGVYVYEVGLKATSDFQPQEADLCKVKDANYVYIGKTFNTATLCNPGDIVTVIFHTLFWYHSEKGDRIRIYEPRFYELRPQQRFPDTTKEALDIAEKSDLLEEKKLAAGKFAAIMCAAPKNKEIRSGTPKQLWSPSKPIHNFISFCEAHNIPYVVLSRKYGLVPSWVEVENYDFFDMNLAEWQVLIEESAKKYNIKEVVLYSRAFLINTDFHEMLDSLKDVSFKQVESMQDLQEEFQRQETLDEIKESQGLSSIELSEGEKLPLMLARYPSEEKTYNFVVQYHFRGKSVHVDFRVEANDHLEGFTLLNQIEGEIKEDVDSLSEAKKVVRASKWKTDDEFFKVQAIKKAPEPKPWLTVEGTVPKGQVGATKEKEGVFVIDDKGRVEHGSKKSHMAEYFLHGRKYKGRFVATLIPNPYNKRPAFIWFFSKPEDQTPYVLSARARRTGWLPPHGISALPKKIKNKVPQELRFWESSGDAAQEKRAELIEYFKEKRLELIKDISTYDPEHMTNQQLMDDARISVGWYATALDPHKSIKYTKEEIEGVAVKIYKEIARRIQAGKMVYSVSEEKSETYEKLWNEIKSKLSEREIDLLTQKEVQEAAEDFIIQHRWYRGPYIVREGPTYEEYDLKIGKMQFRLDKDPLKESSMNAREETNVLRPQFWKEFKKEVELKPGTPENEKPNTPAFLITHVKGKVNILQDDKLFKKFNFASGLKGMWIMKRSTPQGVWNFERSEEVPSTESEEEFVQMSFIPFSSPFKETEEGLEVPGIALSSGVWNNWYFPPEVVRDRPERIMDIPVCIEHIREKEVGKPTKVTLNGDNIEVVSLITDPEGIEFAKKKAKGYSIDALLNVDRTKKVVKQIKEYVELTLTEAPACAECIIEKPAA